MANKNNYYQLVYKNIENDLKNFILSSGFNKKILLNLYSYDDIKKDVHNYFQSFYDNQDLKIENQTFKDTLIVNINNYISDNNIIINNPKDLAFFVDSIYNIYIENITLNHYLDSIKKDFMLVNDRLFIIILISVGMFFITWKKKYLDILFFSSGVLIISFMYYFLEQVDINHLFIINEAFSKLIINILFYDIYLLFIIVNVIITLGFLRCILEYIFIKKNHCFIKRSFYGRNKY